MKNDLVKSSSEQAVTTSFQFTNLDQVREWGKEVVNSGLTPLKKPEAVVAAVMMGKELGLEPMVSVNNIIPINGKATLGIHLINALLLKAGVVTEVLREYEPCFRFALKGDNNDPIITKIDFIDGTLRDGESRGKSIVDYKTVVRMTRSIKQPDGSWKEMIITKSFSWSDAITAGLHEKDNWKNYPAILTLKMATVTAARIIAADVLLGMYETGEMADAAGVPYSMTDDGKVTIIESTVTKSKSNESFDEASVELTQKDDSENYTTTETQN
jgi:hypothetical protein